MKILNKQPKRQDDPIKDEIVEVKREWRNFLKFGNENHLLFGAFIIVLCSILAVNALYVLNSRIDDGLPIINTLVRPESAHYVTSTQVGKNGALTATIKNVTENDTKDMAFTIDPSETMLILDVTITNNTPGTQHLLPSIQFYARSDEGDYAALHASMYAKNPIPAMDLKPGESASGEVSFNVPKRVARPLVYIDTGWDDSVPVIFDALH